MENTIKRCHSKVLDLCFLSNRFNFQADAMTYQYSNHLSSRSLLVLVNELIFWS